MAPDIHSRARSLLDRQAVEGIEAIDTAERLWLQTHLEDCAECAASALALDCAIRDLRLARVELPPLLAERTQMRVYLRARSGSGRISPALAVAFALCWLAGVASAPLVWHGFEWAGGLAGIPQVWLKLALGLWWGIPAAIAALVWSMEKMKEPQ